MKRARTEQMQAIVLAYLKKRNYTDSEASYKLEFKFEDTIQEMTTRASEEICLSTSNTAALTVFNVDEYFSSFTNLLDFVDSVKGKQKELTFIIYPVFCHMYLDLIMAGRKSDAVTFFRYFQVKVSTKCENQTPSLKTLAQISQPIDVKMSEEVNEFRKKKTTVRLSYDSHEIFLRFLHSNDCLILLKIINLHILIKTIEENTLFDLFSITKKPLRKSESSKVVKRKRMISTEQPKVNGIEHVIPKPEPVTLVAPSILSPPTPVSAPVDPAQSYIPEVDMKMLQSSIQSVDELKPSIGNICIHSLGDTGLTHATISNDFTTISTGFEDSTVKLWNMSVKSERKNEEINSKNSQTDNSNSGSLPPDVSKIHLGCDYYKTVKSRLESNNMTNRVQSSMRCFRAHSDTVCDSVFSHDDKFLLTCSEDTTVRLWDISTGKNKAIYRGHVCPVWCISMSNYSIYFATGSFDKTARLWTTERTYPLRTFAGHHGDVECVSFHNNVSYLATSDKSIRLWDLASGKTVRLLLGHWAAVTCLAFSKNGKYLASSGEDGRIRMWDIASGALIKEMRGHEGAVYSLDFSPDDTMLTSGGADSFLRVWNTRTSQTPATKNTSDSDDPDFIGRWQISSQVLHKINFESCNLLHCITTTNS